MDNIGIKETFLDSAYLYGTIGAFMGISLTVEKKCGVWWEATYPNKFLKVLIALIFDGVYIFCFSKEKIILLVTYLKLIRINVLNFFRI